MGKRLVWQGSFDMLCGIYCAAHLIACFKVKNSSPENQAEFYESAAETAFYKLMLSVEGCGLLTAERLARPNSKKSGFNDRQLEKIFNNLEDKDREGLIAIAFCRSKIKILKNSERRAMLRRGACAIVNQSGENHWITVDGKHRDGGYYSFSPCLEDVNKSIPQIGWEKGLFVAEPKVIKF